MPINFTLKGRGWTNDVDDESGDVGRTSVTGWFIFTPQLNRPVNAPDDSPDPSNYWLREFKGYMDSDGQLKNTPGGTVGVRLWANDPLFNLARLPYRITAELTDPIGRPVPWTPFNFEAPDTDVIVWLDELTPVPGTTGEGVVQGPRGYGITGDFLGHSANQAAMLALTGAVGDWTIRSDTQTIWVIVGTPTSSLANWVELEYPAVTLDSDLQAIAALSASNDDVIQRKSGVWTNRTVAQVKSDLGTAVDDAAVLASATGRAVAFAIVFNR